MPLLSGSKRPVLRWVSLLLFALGLASLGFAGFSLLDQKLFQAYENRQLDQARLSPAVKNLPRLSAKARPQAGPASPSSGSEVPRAAVPSGSALGRIEIGRIGIAAIIVEGTSGRSLQRAVGHVTGTAMPGEQGNVAIAGHRDTFFRALRDIRQGDEVTLTTRDGSYRYRVDWMKVVAPKDTEVLNDSGESLLTLVTCYPFYFVGPAPKRFVVRAIRN